MLNLKALFDRPRARPEVDRHDPVGILSGVISGAVADGPDAIRLALVQAGWHNGGDRRWWHPRWGRERTFSWVEAASQAIVDQAHGESSH